MNPLHTAKCKCGYLVWAMKISIICPKCGVKVECYIEDQADLKYDGKRKGNNENNQNNELSS